MSGRSDLRITLGVLLAMLLLMLPCWVVCTSASIPADVSKM